jgi:hypothetical protein
MKNPHKFLCEFVSHWGERSPDITAIVQSFGDCYRENRNLISCIFLKIVGWIGTHPEGMIDPSQNSEVEYL